MEVHLDHLIGRRVLGLNGRPVGRLEEVKAEIKDDECLVSEYHVGSYAAFERLSALSIGRTVLKLFRLAKGGYRVPWDQLDVSEPARLRLRCRVGDLKPLE